MVISKKTIISMVSEGGATFARGVQLFSGGGRVQMLISIETHITFDLPGGYGPPIPSLDPHMQLDIHSPEKKNNITDVRALTCTTFHFIFSFYCFFI